MAAAATVTVVELLGKDFETGQPLGAGCERDPQAEVMALIDRALLFIDGGIRGLRDAG